MVMQMSKIYNALHPFIGCMPAPTAEHDSVKFPLTVPRSLGLLYIKKNNRARAKQNEACLDRGAPPNMYKCFSSLVQNVIRTMCRNVLSVLLPFGATVFMCLGRLGGVLILLTRDMHRSSSMHFSVYPGAFGNLQQATDQPRILHIMRR